MIARRKPNRFGNFGQYPSGIIPHGNWGQGNACFKSAAPGTGGQPVYYPGSLPALLRSCRVSGDTVSCDDSGIISLSDQVRAGWTDEDYMSLPQSTKEELKSYSSNVQRRLTNLKDKGTQTLDEFKNLERVVMRSSGRMNQEVTDAWSNAQSGLTETGNMKYNTFVEIDMLMVYSPKADTAKELCGAKLDAERSFQLTLDKISEISRNVSTKISEFYENRDNWLALIQNLLQAFLAAIVTLINLIREAFSALPAVANWLLSHPKVMWGIGIFMALGIIGVFLRPYIALAGAVFRR